ncbi:UDP-N-acetylmuramoyl-tripeptide--D-alanyl-D-alanine ligase [Phormidium sp. CLA17]|uniref:UDP-N-acetylmuramoyl-tripeptide--D-alanyl-D- alanine ligase n=1 Tax=Leptolyngbya sp. Cla-17 TaxID=2803751 RepID=UPI001491EBEC|nr:UDP-N-acetylmuramoyl-tripeptide--D-alanyl-D-alanine ligase [Leptolyngbya sp. Cla-17]MBM0743817.1 UDP-N-acetylmuramoyl-tripeptide--D-alanyl-D-alanine ligase [Leptolyngbya sp. Cla-17]
MPCQATLTQLVSLLNATLINLLDDAALTTLATGITTDTRAIKPGEVFVALRGEQFDGHQFVTTAFEKGAIAAIVDGEFLRADFDTQQAEQPFPLIQVKDTLVAYQAIAHWWRTQFTIPVIAVTGSVGKTTTKELIAAVLSHASPGLPQVLKTQANYNNEIGVPKTLLELDASHDYAIVEMGMRGRGEIALLSTIAQPTIAVITNVGTAHIERLGSELAIAQAKCELLAELSADSIAILNHDNPLLLKTAAEVWQGKTLTFGLDGGDIHGHLLDPNTLQVEGIDLPLPLPGRHNAINYLAALTVAKVLGLDWSPLMQGMTVELPGGRAKRYDLPNDIVILDETYNAGLESMLASLHLLMQTPGKRHIAILGTMKELGERSPEFHQRVGFTAQQLQVDYLLILADPLEAAAMKAGAAGIPTECFTSQSQLVERLKVLAQSGDRLLFKASRAVGLDQVVNQFRRDRCQ